MTPAERARQIDLEEFESECRAIRQRAYAYVEHRKHVERCEIANWLGRIPPSPRFITKFEMPKKPKSPHVRRKGQPHTINGETRTSREWAEHLGISYVALCGRVHRLGTLEAAVALGSGDQRRTTPGAVNDFAPSIGTGGGSTAQESTEITFSEKAIIE